MGAGLCAVIEEEKEEETGGEEGAQYSLDSYTDSQLTDFPKSRRWEASGGEREMPSLHGHQPGGTRHFTSLLETVSDLSESALS